MPLLFHLSAVRAVLKFLFKFFPAIPANDLIITWIRFAPVSEFFYFLLALVTYKKCLAFLNPEERNKKQAEIVVSSLVMGAGQTANRA